MIPHDKLNWDDARVYGLGIKTEGGLFALFRHAVLGNTDPYKSNI